jgi:hypothetical protein
VTGLWAVQSMHHPSFSGKDKRLFSFKTSRPDLEPKSPPIKCVQGNFSPGVYRPGPEAHHSSPFSTDIKNQWNYINTPHLTHPSRYSYDNFFLICYRVFMTLSSETRSRLNLNYIPFFSSSSSSQ